MSVGTRRAVALAVAIALSSNIQAQQSDDGLQEIVVTGSRAMLINAIEAQASEGEASVPSQPPKQKSICV